MCGFWIWYLTENSSVNLNFAIQKSQLVGGLWFFFPNSLKNQPQQNCSGEHHTVNKNHRSIFIWIVVSCSQIDCYTCKFTPLLGFEWIKRANSTLSNLHNNLFGQNIMSKQLFVGSVIQPNFSHSIQMGISICPPFLLLHLILFGIFSFIFHWPFCLLTSFCRTNMWKGETFYRIIWFQFVCTLKITRCFSSQLFIPHPFLLISIERSAGL